MSILTFKPKQLQCRGISSVKLNNAISTDSDDIWRICTQSEACESKEYRFTDNSTDPNNFYNNFYTKFNILCIKSDGKQISDNKQQFYMGLFGSFIGAGDIAGSFFFNFITDIQGRKNILVQGGILWILIDIAIFFNTNLFVMQALLVANGFFSFSNHIIGQNQAGEITNSKQKNRFQVAVQMGDACVWSVVCLYWQFVKDQGIFWWIIIAKHIVLISMVAQIFCESPEWLFSKLKKHEFKQTIRQIRDFNGVIRENSEGSFHEFDQRMMKNSDSDDLELIEPVSKCNKQFIGLIILNILLWMIVIFIQQFINQFLEQLKTGVQEALLIQSISQLMAQSLLGFLEKIVCLRQQVSGGFFIFAVVSLLQQFFTNDVIEFILVFCISFTIAQSQLGIYVYTAKSFESSFRGTAFAICNIFGRSMVLAAPLVAHLIADNQKVMSDLMFGLGSLGFIVSLILIYQMHRTSQENNKKNILTKLKE